VQLGAAELVERSEIPCMFGVRRAAHRAASGATPQSGFGAPPFGRLRAFGNWCYSSREESPDASDRRPVDVASSFHGRRNLGMSGTLRRARFNRLRASKAPTYG